MSAFEHKLSAIEQACKITDACFSNLLPFIKPGITEQDLAGALEKLFRQHNVEESFTSIVAFGTHTSVVHYLDAKTSTTRCRKQEIILLDFGVKVNGYCSDMTRMVFVGKPKKEWVTAYRAIHDVQEDCLSKIKNYNGKPFSGAAIDRYARRLISKTGLPPYPHGLGHSVGKEIHELPKLSRKLDALISPPAIFTVEPGTYIEGQFGIRIEDTVAYTKQGLYILTASSKNILIL
jgi:Xaa-Pro aminopeptidase